MTASTTPPWSSAASQLCRWALLLCIVCSGTRADDLRAGRVSIASDDKFLSVDADYQVQLTTRVEEAVRKGVPVYFVYEIELTRDRFRFFTETVASNKRTMRVSFRPLTQQYTLDDDSGHRSFADFAEVGRAIGRLRGWRIIALDALVPDVGYDLRIRLRLDIDRLPKPFQVDALTSDAWHLESPWTQLRFVHALRGLP